MTDEPSRDAFTPRSLLPLVPPLVLLGLLFVWRGWNVVWGDDVSMCPIFDKFYRSTLTFGDLWEPYQGHRVFFHRALELFFGWATHWNVYVEIGFVYATFVADFCLLCWLLQDLPVAGRVRSTLAVVISLSVFSANQLENWTNGWQMGLALSTFCVLAGLTLLAKFGARFPVLFACLAAGVVASYSFGNGIVYWVALVPLLCFKLRGDPRWPAKAALWAAVAVVTILFYFHRLGSTGATMPLGQAVLNIFRVPGTFFNYLFSCTGAGVFFLNGTKANLSLGARWLVASGAPFCGLAGLLASGWTVWRLARRPGADLSAAAPWLSLGLYGVASVGVIAITRYTFPPESAIASRYVTFSQYLWLSLFVLLALLAPRLPRGGWWTLGGILAVCYLISYGNGLRHVRMISLDLKQVRADLLGQPTEQTYRLINGDRDPAQVAAFMEMNRQHRLATFHDAAPPAMER